MKGFYHLQLQTTLLQYLTSSNEGRVRAVLVSRLDRENGPGNKTTSPLPNANLGKHRPTRKPKLMNGTRYIVTQLETCVSHSLATKPLTVSAYISAPTHSDRSEVNPSKTPAGKSLLMLDDMSLLQFINASTPKHPASESEESEYIRKIGALLKAFGSGVSKSSFVLWGNLLTCSHRNRNCPWSHRHKSAKCLPRPVYRLPVLR